MQSLIYSLKSSGMKRFYIIPPLHEWHWNSGAFLGCAQFRSGLLWVCVRLFLSGHSHPCLLHPRGTEALWVSARSQEVKKKKKRKPLQLMNKSLFFRDKRAECSCSLRCVSICSLAFSMEGLYLSASSNTETVHIFKLETQKEKYV